MREGFRARFLAISLALVALEAHQAPREGRAAQRPPNVVVILADDQGWGDLAITGNRDLATPRIDSLARDGAFFEQFFVCPVCSPTRAEFLTGRWHPRGGVWSTSTGGERLDLDETTIAEIFAAAGYATGAFGKWHNGTQWPYHPNARGFAEFFGFTSGHWGQYFDPVLEHNGQTVRGEGYIADVFTDRAIEFIEARRGGPFFCYLAFNTPHSPMQVPEAFYRKFAAGPLRSRHHEPGKEDVPHTRAALAMIENIDANVGRLLDCLSRQNLADDTIVVYFSDNGPNGWRYNGGLRGRKGSTDEGGVRAPCLIRWPGRIPAGARIEPIAGAIDLLPTLAELAAVPLDPPAKPAGQPRPAGGPRPALPLDGVSLAGLLRGAGDPPPPRLIFSHWAGQVSVRSDRFRLDERERLYDMQRDPGQTRDVAAQHPEIARDLAAAAARWKAELLPGLSDDRRPFPVGHRERPLALLPARDGQPHGQIQRSSRAPNCSFFTHWTSTSDAITWEVEVAAAGRYEAVVHYTCAAENVGAVLVLALGDRRVTARVTEAHDPPLAGSADDRVPRQGESYVKEFRPLVLGQFELPAGRGTLVLSAAEMPGPAAIDVRGVALRLLD